MPENTRNRSRVWITLLVLLIAAGFLYMVLPKSRSTVAVRTATVQRQTLINTVSTNGRVESLVDFQPRAPMASEIVQLPIKLGQHVHRGDELVRLDVSDAQSKIAAAQASLTGAEGTLRNMEAGGTQDELLSQRSDLAAAQTQQSEAARALASLQALQQKGAASDNEVASAQQRLTDAQTKVSQIQSRSHGRYGSNDLQVQRAQVSEARASLAAARSGYAGLDIRSPVDGTVYALPYNLFDYVQANDALVSVADLNRLQVRAYFDEPEIGKLAAGEPVDITWDARLNQRWHGRVTQAPTTVTTYNGTRNVGVCLISIDDAHGELIPNINVTVNVTTSQHLNVISVPREALRIEGGKNYVFRVIGGRLVRTPVVVGEGDVSITRVGVRSGLQEGDVVALEATTDVDLTDGMRVKAQR